MKSIFKDISYNFLSLKNRDGANLKMKSVYQRFQTESLWLSQPTSIFIGPIIFFF